MRGNRRWWRLSGMLEGRLGTVGCGGEAGGGGARVGRDDGHDARAGEGNRALYSRPMRRHVSRGPKGGASWTQVPGDGGRTTGKRTTVRRHDVLSILGMRATWGRGDLGERTLGRRVRVAIEVKGRGRGAAARRGARERAAAVCHFGGPLLDALKLQKFVQKCSKW
jgi:hypothetical protein